MKKTHKLRKALGTGLAIVLLISLFLFFLSAISNVRTSQNDEGCRRLEESLRRAAVACYATEGIYPPTVDYLERQYGIQIDRELYAVFYDVFAENLMPDITVVSLD